MNRSVTIGIPCHNAQDWLAIAIDSALACKGVSEVIVVDDGSIDKSPAIAHRYGDRIRFFQQPKSGGNVARNRALGMAAGEWIQFLDADDYLLPNKIDRQLDEAGPLEDSDVLYSPVWIETWRNGQAIGREQTLIEPQLDLVAQWIAWQLPQTGGALWRRTALQGIGGWREDQPCCQEHELYLRAIIGGLRFRHCPSPGAVYRIWSEETVCRRDPVQVIKERTRLIDRAMDWLEQSGAATPVHHAIAGRICFELARTWTQLDPKAGTEYYRERRACNRLRPEGPAAPWKYRLALALLGIAGAERLARATR